MLQHYRETNHITTFVFMILEDNIYIYIKTYKYICVYNIKNECTTGKAPGQIFVLGKGAWANWNNCGKSLNLRSALSMNRITLRERVNGTKPLMLDVLSHLFLKRRRNTSPRIFMWVLIRLQCSRLLRKAFLLAIF